MSGTNITFSALHSEDKEKTFRLKVEWEEDYFNLFVLEGNKAWFALVTSQHLAQLAEQLDLHLATYKKNLREYICNTSSSISVGVTPRSSEFIIYQHIEKEKLKVKYFVIKLEKLDYQQYVEELIDSLTTKYKEMSDLLLAVEEEEREVKKEKTSLEYKCQEMAEIKSKADREIYNAVASVLNEKKTRIQFLMELLDDNPTGIFRKRPVHNQVNTNDRGLIDAKPSTSKREMVSDSESSAAEDYNTDDDESIKSPQQSNVDDDLDFLGGDSPSPPVLPKRFKSDNDVCLPCPSMTDNQKTISHSQKTDLKVNESPSFDDESQEAHLDTQDLLNMM